MMRRRRPIQESGAPGWIVTFADMMGLIMMFFVLMVSMSHINANSFKQALISMQNAFGVFPENTNSPVTIMAGAGRRGAERLRAAAARLEHNLRQSGKALEVKVQFDAQGGLKINVPSSLLFDAGSATLRPEALPVLKDVAEVLSQLPDTFVEVRGHTDGQPLGDALRFRDNYDLSYFRADAVTRQLSQFGGVPIEQFEIIACGPSQPLATNDTPEGRNANRRVEIYVRGLVDRRKMQMLREGYSTLQGPENPPVLPASPHEYDNMR